MKKIYRIGLILSLSTILFTPLLLLKNNPAENTYIPPSMFPGNMENEEEEASVGTPEDPNARENYELLRLHDPSTGRIPEGIRERELQFGSTLPKMDISSKSDKSLGKTNASIWTKRGPFNVGGRTRALGIDVSNENVILAGGISGGMWRSANGGASWTKTTNQDHLHSVTCLTQDTRAGKTNIWYYGTGEYKGNSTSGNATFFLGDGIFKSVDGGQTWTPLASTVLNTPHSWDGDFDICWNLATDPSNTSEDEVYAAVYNGLMRSTNGGNSWTGVFGDFSTFTGEFVDVAVTSDGVVYVTMSSDNTTGQNGIWRSTDGLNYTNITPAGWPSTYSRIVIGVSKSDEKQVYFLGETSGSGTSGHSLWKYTYVSGDGTGAGGTWINRSGNLPNPGNLTGNFDSQGSYDLLIKVKPDNSNVVFIGGTNLYRSDDGFASTGNTKRIGGYEASGTTYGQYTNHHPDQHSLAFYPSNASKMISGHDGGLSLTTNNLASTVSWTFLNNGYSTTQFYTVAFDQIGSNDPIISGGLQDNGTWYTTSVTSTATWENLYSGDGAYCAIANNKAYYYVSSQNGTTYQISGSNGNWARVDPSGGANYRFINPFILDPNNTNMMYMAGGEYLWRNSNLTELPQGGNYDPPTTNWTKMTNTLHGDERVTIMASSKTPANILYYGSKSTNSNTPVSKLYKITGANSGNPVPVSIKGSNFPTNGYINCIAIDPTDANKVMVVYANYNILSLYYSNDGGTNWTEVGGNLEQNADGTGSGPSLRWATILPVSGGTVYILGTSIGVYATSTLNGRSTVWLQQGQEVIGNVVADMVISRTSDNTVVAGTHGNGVFSAKYTSTSVFTPENIQKPETIVLYDNYPNPFNPSTTINYFLPENMKVKLEVFNSNGQLISVLENGIKTAGENHSKVDASKWSSGTYLYRLTTEKGKIITKKMILVK